MKVYFACSSNKVREYLKVYLSITNSIRFLGYDVYKDWLSNVSTRKVDDMEEVKERERLRREGIEAIREADLLVAEISWPSVGVGYQIATALDLKKPILCLYSADFGMKKPSQIVRVTNSPLLVCKKYSKTSLRKVLADYLAGYRTSKIIKFNFIITPEINQYLDWKSGYGRVSKSEILRKLVMEKVILTDSEYTQGRIKQED